jgi:Superinfection immunity protein
MLRGHQSTAAILVLNLLLGWTLLFWVIALVWAFTPVGTNPRQARHILPNFFPLNRESEERTKA